MACIRPLITVAPPPPSPPARLIRSRLDQAAASHPRSADDTCPHLRNGDCSHGITAPSARAARGVVVLHDRLRAGGERRRKVNGEDRGGVLEAVPSGASCLLEAAHSERRYPSSGRRSRVRRGARCRAHAHRVRWPSALSELTSRTRSPHSPDEKVQTKADSPEAAREGRGRCGTSQLRRICSRLKFQGMLSITVFAVCGEILSQSETACNNLNSGISPAG